MRRRPFGKTGLQVSEFGVGCARIGGIFQGNSGEFLRLLEVARDRGVNFFDTADMYSQGESEQLVGRAFRRGRDRVIIATKVGYCLPGRRKLAARLKPLLRPVIKLLGLRRDRLPAGARGALTQDFSPPYIRKAVEASLRRLRTDYVDLLQLHSPPTEVIERGEWERPLEDLKRAGRVRHYGIAVDTVDAGLAALRFPGVSSVQFTLNLFDQRAAEALLPKMRAQGVAGIARECLANGILAKTKTGLDLAAHCGSPDEARDREERLAPYREQASREGTSIARVALDYAAGVDGVSVALLGVRSVDQLNGLLDLVARTAST
jgi:aryl-alcohol dehydrogenase-like predicted oxidoreductase